jgi:uncharacterized cupin superfamily protein
MKLRALAMGFAVLAAGSALAADVVVGKPTVITAAEGTGPIFQHPKVFKSQEAGKPAKGFQMLSSADKKVSAGIYEGPATTEDIEAYNVDEFMYFLTGGVTLTSADGTVQTIKAGDAVTIPKGWKGRWHSEGYTKYYVVYNVDKK